MIHMAHEVPDQNRFFGEIPNTLKPGRQTPGRSSPGGMSSRTNLQAFSRPRPPLPVFRRFESAEFGVTARPFSKGRTHDLQSAEVEFAGGDVALRCSLWRCVSGAA